MKTLNLFYLTYLSQHISDDEQELAQRLLIHQGDKDTQKRLFRSHYMIEKA